MHGQRLIMWFSNLFQSQKSNVIPTMEEEVMLQQRVGHHPSPSFKRKECVPGSFLSPTIIFPTSPSQRKLKSDSMNLSVHFLSSLPILAQQDYAEGRLDAARLSLRKFFGALRHGNISSSYFSSAHLSDCGEQRGLEEINGEKDHDDVCTPNGVLSQLRGSTILALELAALTVPPADDFENGSWMRAKDEKKKKKDDDSITFGAMVLCAVQSFPEIRDRIALIELRAASHHLPSMLEELPIDHSECRAGCIAEEDYESIGGDGYGCSLSCKDVTCEERNEEDGCVGCGTIPHTHSQKSEERYFTWFSGAGVDGIRVTRLHCLQTAICLRMLKIYSCASSWACGVHCSHPHSDRHWWKSNPTLVADITSDSAFYACASILTDLCLLHLGVSPLTLGDQALHHFTWLRDDDDDGETSDVEVELDWYGPNSEVLSTDDEAERGRGSISRNSECGEEYDVSVRAMFSPEVNGRNHWLWNDEDIPQLNVPSSWCRSEESVMKLVRNLRYPEYSPILIKMILWPVYKLIPERSHLKARFAFTLGLLASQADCGGGGDGGTDIAESMYLECVMVLNRLGEEGCCENAFDEPSDPSYYPPHGGLPLLTHFGVNVLEKLGDALTKNGKYEYGILALERSIDCYALVAHNNKKQHIKLVRRVALLTLAHKDSYRALQYHIQLLRGAHAEHNVNEFVYLSLEIARMLVEQGEYAGAEQYYFSASHLLSGAKLDQVQLRSPNGGSTTATTTTTTTSKDSNVTSSASSNSNSSGGLIASGAFPVPEYTPAAGAAAAAAAAAQQSSSSVHQSGGGSAASVGCHRHSMTSWELNFAALPFQAAAAQAIPETISTFSGSERFSASSDIYHNMVVDGMESRGGGGGVDCGAMDTQQFSLQMKLVELYTVSQQYEKALRLWNGLLLNRGVPGNHRSEALIGVARCYLKLNRVAECDAALERIVHEADECLGGFDDLTSSSRGGSDNGGGPSPTGSLPSTATHVEYEPLHVPPMLFRRSTTHGDSDKIMNFMATSAVSTVKSVEFLALRSKCCLVAGDPVAALHWIKIALATCGHSGRAAKRGKLIYLKARCHAALSKMAKERREKGCGGGGSRGSTFSSRSFPQQVPVNDASAASTTAAAQDGAEVEKTEMELALDAFSRSASIFCEADDVQHLGKCLASESEFLLSQIFVDVVIRGVPLKHSALGDGEAILDMADAKANQALDVAADVASPLPLIVSFLNAAEVYLLRGRTVLAYKAWKEAQTILTLTYLQRQVVEEYMAEQQTDLDLQSAANYAYHSAITGSLEKGGCAAAASSAKRYMDEFHSFWKRRSNLSCYPALPSVPHPPYIMRRVYAILSRVVRLSFALTGLHCGTFNVLMMTPDLMPPHLERSSGSCDQPAKFNLNRDSAIPPAAVSPFSTTFCSPEQAAHKKGIGVAANILASSALPNSTHLLAGWLVLDALTHHSYHPPATEVLLHGGGCGGGKGPSPTFSHAAVRTSPPHLRRKSCGTTPVNGAFSDAEAHQGGEVQVNKRPCCNTEIDISLPPPLAVVLPPRGEEPPPTPHLGCNDNELVVSGITGSGDFTTASPTSTSSRLLVKLKLHQQQQQLKMDEGECNCNEKVVVPFERSCSNCSIHENDKLMPVGGGVGVCEDSSRSMAREDVITTPHRDKEKMENTSSKVQSSVQMDFNGVCSSSSHSGHSTLAPPASADRWQDRDRMNTTSGVSTGSEGSSISPSSSLNNEQRSVSLSSPDDLRVEASPRGKSGKLALQWSISISLPNTPEGSGEKRSTLHEGFHLHGPEDVEGGSRPSGRENVHRSCVCSLCAGVRTGGGHGTGTCAKKDRRRHSYQSFASMSASLEAVHHALKHTNSSPIAIEAAARESAIAFQHEHQFCGKATATTTMGNVHHDDQNASSSCASSIVDESSLYYTAAHAPQLLRLRMTETGQLIDIGFEHQCLEGRQPLHAICSPTQTQHTSSTMNKDSKGPVQMDSLFLDRPSGEVCGACPCCNSKLARIQYVQSQLQEASPFHTSHRHDTPSHHYKGIRKRLSMHLNHFKSSAGAVDAFLSIASRTGEDRSGSGGGLSSTSYHHHRKAEVSSPMSLNSWLFLPFFSGEGRRASTLPAGYSGFDVGISKRSPYDLHLGMRSTEEMLWISFCKMKQANKLYSSRKLALSDLRCQNLEIMRQIFLTGKEMGRPILRLDRYDRSDQQQQHSKGGNSRKEETRAGGWERETAAGAQLRNVTNRGIKNLNKIMTPCDMTTPPGLSAQQLQQLRKSAFILAGSAYSTPSYECTATENGGRSHRRMVVESPFGGTASSTTTTVNSSPIARLKRLSRWPPDYPAHGSFSDVSLKRASDPGSCSNLGNISANTPTRRHSAASVSKALVDVLGGIPLRCRHAYPTAFAFTFFMDGTYFYYCPSTGKMSVKTISGLCAPPVSSKAKLRICPLLLGLRWAKGLDYPRSAARSSLTSFPKTKLMKVVVDNHHITPKTSSKGSRFSEAVDEGGGGSSLDNVQRSPPPRGAAADDVELYDNVLYSISESQPSRCIPLVPEHHEAPYFLSKDDAVNTVVDMLSPQFTLFLVTALLLEQPVLMVASPGEEGLLASIGVGLLQLLRPLQWQYTHISVCPFSSMHLLLHCIRSKQPFLIGVHTSTLDYISPLKRGICNCSISGSCSCCDRSKGFRGGGGVSTGYSGSMSRGGKSGGGGKVPHTNIKTASSDIGGLSSTHASAPYSTKMMNILPSPTDRTSGIIDMNHVTIVNLDSGILIPSVVLKHAAAVALNHPFTPVADPALGGDTLGFPATKGVCDIAFDFLKDYGGMQAELSPLGYFVPGMLPPLPAQYRYRLGRCLDAVMPSLDGNDKGGNIEKGGRSCSSPNTATAAADSSFGAGGNGAKTPPRPPLPNREKNKANAISKYAETLQYNVFLMLADLLKPYHLFLDDGPWGTAKSPFASENPLPSPPPVEAEVEAEAAGMPNMSNVDVEAFLSFNVDDRRAFLRVLLSTKAVSVFINTSAPFHFPSFIQDEQPSQHPQQQQRKAEAAVQQPIAAVATFCTESSNIRNFESSSVSGPPREQMRTFREEFELAIQARMRHKLKLFQGVTHKRFAGNLLIRMAQEGQDVTRKAEKRRWCVLDAGRFSYYRNKMGRGRKQKLKGQIALDPRSVSLISPPFLVPPLGNDLTSEANSVALISAILPPEVACIVIRAESFKTHQKWVQALKARLTPKETANRMDGLYSSGVSCL